MIRVEDTAICERRGLHGLAQHVSKQAPEMRLSTVHWKMHFDREVAVDFNPMLKNESDFYFILENWLGHLCRSLHTQMGTT